MQPFPHHYVVSASGKTSGFVTIEAPELPSIETAPPPEFDGPRGTWSPETLLTAAVADCFILTFRAVARAANYSWIALDCRVEGTLERIEGRSRFAAFTTTARLTIPPDADTPTARHLLEKAEHGCLIANSLRAERALLIELIPLTDTRAAVQPA